MPEPETNFFDPLFGFPQREASGLAEGYSINGYRLQIVPTSGGGTIDVEIAINPVPTSVDLTQADSVTSETNGQLVVIAVLVLVMV